MTKRSFDPTGLAASIGAGSGEPSTPGADARRSPELCGDLDMRIARDGTWFYHGSPIGRKPLVRLFASVLSRDEDGEYWLTTPVERGRIEVDDAPFVAVELTVSGSGKGQSLRFRTSIDDEVTAAADHPIRVSQDPKTGEPAPYVLVRGRLEALIARAVFYQLVEHGVEKEVDGDHMFGVWSEGCFFPIATMPDDQ